MFIPFIIGPVIFFIVVVVIIVNVVKASKKGAGGLINSDFFDNVKEAASKMNDAVQSAKTTTCEYCGSVVDKNAKKCPNCSASISRK